MNEIAINHLKAAYNAFCKGAYNTAIKCYQEIIKLNGEDPSALYMIAYCYKAMDQTEDAIIYCKKVLTLDSNNFHALQMMASIYEERRDYANAYECVKQALENPPFNPSEPPKWLARVLKPLFEMSRQKDIENEFKNMWEMEQEDRDWLKWAKEFKAQYESGQLNA